jgi:sulfate adenylyltransferase
MSREPDRRAKESSRDRPAGFALFLSGLSGAGKSTIALALQRQLAETELRYVKVLDGEMFRFSVPRNHDNARALRGLTTLRIASVAAEITRSGGVAVCAAIAPSEKLRERARVTVEKWGRFILVYLSTPLSVCEQRDCKGIYHSIRAGSLECLTGITDPYEVPEHPDLTIDTSNIPIETAVGSIVQYLRNGGLVHRE